MPVPLVRERGDIVRPIPEIALKALQDIGVVVFDRLFDEADTPCLAGRDGRRQRPSERKNDPILGMDQQIGVLGLRRADQASTSAASTFSAPR